MEKYVVAAGLYLFGIFVYNFYFLVICNEMREIVEYVHEHSKVPYTDQLIKTVACILTVLSSFIWPVSMIFDMKDTFRKENKA